MTNEKMYELACAAIRELAEDRATADDIIARPRFWVESKNYSDTAYLLLTLLEKLDCTGGKASTVAAVKRIIKIGAKSGRLEPHGWIDEEGRFCACSGYHFVRLTQDLPSIPHGDRGLDLDATLPSLTNLTPISLPKIGDIRAHIAAQKDKTGGVPFIVPGLDMEWACNAHYLLDIMQALPGCTAYAPEGALRPMYFSGPNGSDGMLLPVRVRHDTARFAGN